MKNRILILMVVILGSLGIADAQNRKDTRTILDYYKLVPSNVLDDEEAGIEVKDTENGYLWIVIGQDGNVEVALFRKKDRTPILVISEMVCDEDCKNELSAYQLIRNRMVDVTNLVIPKFSDSTIQFSLPRYGKTIRAIKDYGFKSLVAEFTWKNDKFGVKTSDDIFRSIKSVVTTDVSPFYKCNAQNTKGFILARINVEKNERAYFYKIEEANYSASIDEINKAKYRTKNYLISGDEVLVMKMKGYWACAYYQSKSGKRTIGLIPINKLSFIKSNGNINNWLGTWKDSDVSWFNIKRSNIDGKVYLDGYSEAEFRGDPRAATIEDVIKSPVGNLIIIKGEEDNLSIGDDGCRIYLQLMGSYLVVTENDRCAIPPVTFRGIYKK